MEDAKTSQRRVIVINDAEDGQTCRRRRLDNVGSIRGPFITEKSLAQDFELCQLGHQ